MKYYDSRGHFFDQLNTIGTCLGYAIITMALLIGLSLAAAHAGTSTMSICKAEGIIHGPQAATTCRANLRIYQARHVIQQCRTEVMKTEHKVFGQTRFSKVKLPKDCTAYTLMSSNLAGVNYVPLPNQIKLAPYSKVLDMQKPVPLTRYHGGSTVINY
ncbi:conserved protein of unknown function [Acidithiobacillus ferrivorans]|uniref:Uncharacterized protein n=1 Tax=Acidithiobacillus ferrivorans TaxID=160808 RepID=A0A060ULG9_9PROT|nr:hypothetical protein [Acidithiobacillus ferrivorans]CDQ09201.1 conserved exported hypothetical protein [Acidithiobacillus ferrivorans]SMH64869.1 conserved protein of unknown function [Acidithiobacillus ferrivorans]